MAFCPWAIACHSRRLRDEPSVDYKSISHQYPSHLEFMSSGRKNRGGGYISKASPPSPFSSRNSRIYVPAKDLASSFPFDTVSAAPCLTSFPADVSFWAHAMIGYESLDVPAKELAVSLTVSTVYVAFRSTSFSAVMGLVGRAMLHIRLWPRHSLLMALSTG